MQPDIDSADPPSGRGDQVWSGPARLTTDQVIVAHEIRRPEPVDGLDEGLGVILTEPVPAGTTCVVFGGYVTPGAVFDTLPDDRQHHSLQIGDDLFLVCDEHRCHGDFVNHSCEPTLWLTGEITLVARRDLVAGEQLSFDYATTDSQPYDEFECACGTSSCRAKVTGNDWMLPELQRRYAGHFSPYLQRRIDAR